MIDLPEPLAPAEIDIRGFSGFMLDVDRLLASELVALGSPEECWCAVMLWCRAWKQHPAASLPNDDRVLAAFSTAGKRWPKVKAMALRGFVLCSDGRFYHRVLAEEAITAWKKRKEYRSDQDRLRKWREAKRSERHGTPGETLPETAPETAVKPVSSGVSEPDRQGQGQGQGQLEEKEEEPNPERSETPTRSLRSPARYAFEGRVIRLKLADLHAWKTSYFTIPDMIAELRTIDAKLADEGMENGSKWFGRVSGWLRARHEKILVLQHDTAAPSDEQWYARLKTWFDPARGGPTKDRWMLGLWGPAPGEPGCQAPPGLLAEFTLSAAQ